MDAITRLAVLEKRVRVLTRGLGVSLCLLVVLVTTAWTRRQEPSILRARALIIVDSLGRERIRMGSPVPEPPGRISRMTGLAIRDTAGAERFGLGLHESGQMSMGFDAPPGTGDDRNRERINIVADPKGGAYIRFLNRRTLVAGYLSLGRDDRMWLEFVDVRPDSVVLRRIGFHGEERSTRPR